MTHNNRSQQLVYGRDNRLKVSRDEAKFEEEEKVRKDKHRKAEQEHRHKLLLQRVRGRSDPSDAPALTTSEAQLDIKADTHPAHINFWAEDEVLAGNPEVTAEKKQEQRKRGNKDTQTSDAKFDARFQLAHGLYGKGSQPWYAQPGRTLSTQEDSRVPDTGQSLMMLPTSQAVTTAGASQSLELKLPHMKHKKDKKAKKDSSAKHKNDKKSLEELRAERRAREEAEMARERKLLLSRALQQTDGVLPGKRYHGAYGNARP